MLKRNSPKRIDKENKNCYMIGEFNIDLLKTDCSKFSRESTQQLFTSNVFPIHIKLTRITNKSATLIDSIFTNIVLKCRII